jgi:signal recognition particle receptor subunit beta
MSAAGGFASTSRRCRGRHGSSGPGSPSSKGADGVVFVADSAPARQEANAESFTELRRNLAAAGQDTARFPVVLQANKRDLPDSVPLAELQVALDAAEVPLVSSVATTGEGVFEALRAACRSVAAVL